MPGLTAAGVLLDRDDVGAAGHSVGVEHSGEMINFVGNESSNTTFEHCDVGAAVRVLMLDVEA